MKRKITKIFILIIFALSFWSLPGILFAASFDFNYIEFGTDVRDNDNYHYSVVNKKTNFNTDEDVRGLVKVTNIRDVGSFYYQGQLYRGGSIHMHWQSQTFYPNRAVWGHNYDWKNFGKLPSGEYEFKVSIVADGHSNYLGSARFNVGGYGQNYGGNYIGPNYYQHNNYTQPYYNYGSYQYPYYNQPSYYYGPAEYKHEWTYTGTGVNNTSSWIYQIVNNKTKFYENENVYALTKMANIRNIDNFRIKHEFYLHGSQFYRANELPLQYPRSSHWSENYSWSNFGKPAPGNHKIKTYISVNGGAYQYLAEKNITVERSYDHYRDYRYEWTWTDNNINYSGNYQYSVNANKTVFTTTENVKALTRLSDIRGIENFRIRHDLYQGSSQIQRKEAPMQYPNYGNWQYNYAQNDFGKLAAGDYNIKVYISVNGGAYQLLDTVYFTVRSQYSYSGYPYYSPNYSYNWTVLGQNPYYYN